MVQRNRNIFIASFVAVATIAFVVFMLSVNRVNAQVTNGNGFSVSPTRLLLPANQDQPAINPGDTVTTEITVTNINEEATTVRMEVNDFLPHGESGTPKLILDPNVTTDFTLKDYVLPVEPFQLGAKESREVPIVIRVPENATPGGHYGVVRFTAQNSEDDGNVALSASVGTPVLLEVSGDLVFDVELLELTAARDEKLSSFFEYSPNKIVTRLQNNGNTHIQPFGTLSIKNALGKKIHSFELNSPVAENAQRGYLIPNSVRRFENKISNNLYFGRYTIEGNISYNSGAGDIITVSESFWVIPWKLMIVAAVVLAGLIWSGRRMLRAYNKRVIRSSRRY